MSLNNPSPPLLLTKRLTSFLNANLSPTLHAAILATPSGKLLAHAATPSSSTSSAALKPTSAHTSTTATPATAATSDSNNPASSTTSTTTPSDSTSTALPNHNKNGPSVAHEPPGMGPGSPKPGSVALLRTQATVAASLYTLHASASSSIPDALPGSHNDADSESPLDGSSSDEGSSSEGNGLGGGQYSRGGHAAARTASHAQGNHSETAKKSGAKPVTITVQLSHGVMVIRRLKCGLLFVCIGPLTDGAEGGHGHAGGHAHSGSGGVAADGSLASNGGGGLSGQQAGVGGMAAGGGTGGGLAVPGTTTPRGHGHASPAHMPASPSGDSVISTGAATTTSVASGGSSVAGSLGAAAVVSMRRHAEDLARWLDDKLGSLRVPEEGVGVE